MSRRVAAHSYVPVGSISAVEPAAGKKHNAGKEPR